MRVTHPLLHGSFIERLHRFLASTRIRGRDEYIHVPNSGRMVELLTRGRPIRLRQRSHRRWKTRYDLFLVDSPNESVDPRLSETLKVVYDSGLKVFAFNWEVTEEEITPKGPIPVAL